MKITAIYGSPREGGNTDLLLAEFVRGARTAGAEVAELALRNYHFSPCIECGGCNDTGSCILKDDMDQIYPYLRQSPIICLAAPVFFYSVNAATKAMIDRCQCFWTGKYSLKKPLSMERGCRGKGYLLSVGGTKGQKVFDCVMLTMKYFYDALDMDFAQSLLYRQIDAKAAILNHPEALKEAYELGMKAVTG